MSLLADERTGLQVPRVAVVPPAPSNLADDAGFLASAYGLIPDPWQDSILHGWMGVRADGKWAASRAGLSVPRQNGKNAALEIRELFGLVDLGERFLHTAHEVKTARKAFLRLLGFFDNPQTFPELHDLVLDIRRTNGQEAILLRNGGGVEFVARTKSSGRGFTVDVLVLDEAQELTDEALSALLPTISAAPKGNPQQILTGTPPEHDVDGEVFTRFRQSALTAAPGRVCWMEWSCEPGDDLDDPDQWARANPALGMRENAVGIEAIVDERQSMSDERFARERLGVWREADANSKGWQVIPKNAWAARLDPGAEAEGTLSWAFDVSPDGRSAAIACSNGTYVEVVDHREGMSWVPARLRVLHRDHGFGEVAFDATGPAGALIPTLDDLEVPYRKVTLQEHAQACGGLLDSIEGPEPTLVHRGQPILDAAVEAASRRHVTDVWLWTRSKSTGDISPLVAVTLARWAATSGSDDGDFLF
jgi:hypothetical protein